MIPAVKILSSEMTGIIENVAQKFNGEKLPCDKVIVSGLPEDWTNAGHLDSPSAFSERSQLLWKH